MLRRTKDYGDEHLNVPRGRGLPAVAFQGTPGGVLALPLRGIMVLPNDPGHVIVGLRRATGNQAGVTCHGPCCIFANLILRILFRYGA